MARLLLFAVAVVSLCAISLSCSCRPRTFEQRFCDAKLSVRGKVVATFDNCPGTCDPITDQLRGTIFYVVKIIQKFKGPAVEDNILYLDTAVNDGLCGVKLEVGKEYLLNLLDAVTSGDGGCPSVTRSIGTCHVPLLWKRLTKKEKDFLKKGTGC